MRKHGHPNRRRPLCHQSWVARYASSGLGNGMATAHRVARVSEAHPGRCPAQAVGRDVRAGVWRAGPGCGLRPYPGDGACGVAMPRRLPFAPRPRDHLPALGPRPGSRGGAVSSFAAGQQALGRSVDPSRPVPEGPDLDPTHGLLLLSVGLEHADDLVADLAPVRRAADGTRGGCVACGPRCGLRPYPGDGWRRACPAPNGKRAAEAALFHACRKADQPCGIGPAGQPSRWATPERSSSSSPRVLSMAFWLNSSTGRSRTRV